MAVYEASKAAAYRLADARTGVTLLVLPVQAYGSEQHALCAAGRQARRHASSGTWVLVTGAGRALLYVGDRCFVRCDECGGWMVPRRRGNVCQACRNQMAAAPPVAASPGKKLRPPIRRRRRRVPPEQLALPDFESLG